MSILTSPIPGPSASPFLGQSVAGGLGGYIQITNNRTIFPPGLSFAGANYPAVSVDVVSWRLPQSFEQSILNCSGLMGASDCRQVGYSYRFECVVVWNIALSPETLLRGNETCEIQFYCGGLLSNLTANITQTVSSERYYWIPDAAIEEAIPIMDAGGKKMMRYLFAGRAKTHCFLIPDMGTPNDKTTIAGAYYKYLITSGAI